MESTTKDRASLPFFHFLGKRTMNVVNNLGGVVIFFTLAFALIRRTRTLACYAIVGASLSIAQAGAVAMHLFGTGGSLTLSRLLVVVGSGFFALGLGMYIVLAVVSKRSLVAMARRLEVMAKGDLSLRFLPGWGEASEAQRVWTTLNKMNKEFLHHRCGG